MAIRRGQVLPFTLSKREVTQPDQLQQLWPLAGYDDFVLIQPDYTGAPDYSVMLMGEVFSRAAVPGAERIEAMSLLNAAIGKKLRFNVGRGSLAWTGGVIPDVTLRHVVPYFSRDQFFMLHTQPRLPWGLTDLISPTATVLDASPGYQRYQDIDGTTAPLRRNSSADRYAPFTAYVHVITEGSTTTLGPASQVTGRLQIREANIAAAETAEQDVYVVSEDGLPVTEVVDTGSTPTVLRLEATAFGAPTVLGIEEALDGSWSVDGETWELENAEMEDDNVVVRLLREVA